jgi:hypothetical protein
MEKEEKQKPVVPNNVLENQKETQDDYSVLQDQINDYSKNQVQTNYMPDTAISTAHLLLENSDLTNAITGIDKEMKLANLDIVEKNAIYQFLAVYEDIRWMTEQQEKRIIEAKVKQGDLYDITGEEQLLSEIEDERDKKLGLENNPFDPVGSLKKSLIVPVLSRGKFGFERTKQVETITNYKMENIDKSEQKPGFMDRIKSMGGGNRQ